MNEDRILDKLDGLESKTTEVLVGLARLEEQIKDVPDLKERVRQGEPFRILARKYSHSETRLFEGRLGMIGRGRLPRPLEDVVFALPKGGVSDPVLVSGGARGQGAAEARLLVAQGAKVVIGDLLDNQGQALAVELGPAASFVRHDVTSEADGIGSLLLSSGRAVTRPAEAVSRDMVPTSG